MIQANELRIGNWVYVDDSPVQITSIDKDGGINHTSGDDGWTVDYWFIYQIKDIDPIPLTPEILEKAGFDLTPGDLDNDNISWWMFPDNPAVDLMLREFDKGKGYDLLDMDYGQIHYDYKITSFHQLQNLYFALTGEELEINL